MEGPQLETEEGGNRRGGICIYSEIYTYKLHLMIIYMYIFVYNIYIYNTYEDGSQNPTAGHLGHRTSNFVGKRRQDR